MAFVSTDDVWFFESENPVTFRLVGVTTRKNRDGDDFEALVCESDCKQKWEKNNGDTVEVSSGDRFLIAICSTLEKAKEYVGCLCRVKYLGMARSAKTKREYKKFSVEVDTDSLKKPSKTAEKLPF